MNFKKTALALTVAAVAGTPIIAAAQGSMYASARYGLSHTDGGDGADAVLDFQNFGSRFGIKGDRDMGNGMTAYGHWEIQMFGGALRDFKIGVKDSSKDIYMGDGINHAWDSLLTTDNTWWYGGSQHLTEGVQSSAITYMGSAGGVKFGATMQAQPNTAGDEEMMDQIELAAAFDMGGVNLAVGMTDAAGDPDPDAVMGVVVSGAAGDIGWAFDYQMQDKDNSMQVELGIGNIVAQYGMQNNDAADTTSTALVLSYTQSIADGVLMWYEFANTDADDGSDADTVLAATLKVEML